MRQVSPKIYGLIFFLDIFVVYFIVYTRGIFIEINWQFCIGLLTKLIPVWAALAIYLGFDPIAVLILCVIKISVYCSLRYNCYLTSQPLVVTRWLAASALGFVSVAALQTGHEYWFLVLVILSGTVAMCAHPIPVLDWPSEHFGAVTAGKS